SFDPTAKRKAVGSGLGKAGRKWLLSKEIQEVLGISPSTIEGKEVKL